MEKNTNNANESRSKQNTSAGHVNINLNDYADKEKDDTIAKQNADQYINDVDRSIKQPRNTNTENNKQQ